jgi:2-polyprenyl-3-methyl-5-hydroxy-6-metoxy-1,4-benzoquinol methylase
MGRNPVKTTMKDTSLVTWGDFVDLYYKAKFKGAKFILSRLFKVSPESRVATKWDVYASVSDFWIIPEIKKTWNRKISGDENTFYEDYFWNKYLKDKTGVNLLSIGCGDGGHERNFAKYPNFENITGIDVSQGSVEKARRLAKEQNFNIDYFCDDFFRMDFGNKKFDVILFNASLHHFENIDGFLKNHIAPLLKPDGVVLINEFCGPNRLQWRESQLAEANRLLRKIPKSYKTLLDGKNTKKKVYRPGLIRMLLNDPSEAPDSENLVPALRNNFDAVEEKPLGWCITHILLKDIAHNFLKDDAQTKQLIADLIEAEDRFCTSHNENDAMFGVYRKRTT